jgi:hypothetical protein
MNDELLKRKETEQATYDGTSGRQENCRRLHRHAPSMEQHLRATSKWWTSCLSPQCVPRQIKFRYKQTCRIYGQD